MELARDDWVAYFQSIATEERRLLVAIESVGPRAPVNERIDAMCEGICTRHPLRSIAYEQNADVFEVALGLAAREGPLLRYFVAAPRRIFIREGEAVRAIVVTDAGDTRTLVCVFSVEPRSPRTSGSARPLDRGHGRHRQSPKALHVLAGTRQDPHPRRPAPPRAHPQSSNQSAAERHRPGVTLRERASRAEA